MQWHTATERDSSLDANSAGDHSREHRFKSMSLAHEIPAGLQETNVWSGIGDNLPASDLHRIKIGHHIGTRNPIAFTNLAQPVAVWPSSFNQ